MYWKSFDWLVYAMTQSQKLGGICLLYVYIWLTLGVPAVFCPQSHMFFPRCFTPYSWSRSIPSCLISGNNWSSRWNISLYGWQWCYVSTAWLLFSSCPFFCSVVWSRWALSNFILVAYLSKPKESHVYAQCETVMLCCLYDDQLFISKYARCHDRIFVLSFWKESERRLGKKESSESVGFIPASCHPEGLWHLMSMADLLLFLKTRIKRKDWRA